MLKDMGLDVVKDEITGIKSLIGSIQVKQGDLHQSLVHTQQEHAETKETVKSLEAENNCLKSRLELSENRISCLEKRVLDNKSKILDGQSRSMQDNLVFYGLPESKGENTDAVLMKFLSENMKIGPDYFRIRDFDKCSDSDTIWIRRCHRFGQTGSTSSSRPIVAKLTSGRDCILRHARNLAGTKFFVSTQMPQELNERKKRVSSVYKRAKSEGKKPRYVGRGDSVLVDNQVISAPTLPRCTSSAPEIIKNRGEMQINSTSVIEEKGNRFAAHIGTVKNIAKVSQTILAIKNLHHSVSIASHNMYAVRVQVGDFIQEYCDDDDEHGGSAEILKMMRLHNVCNRVIVVSRWASGIQLGQRRFAIISKCSENILKNNALLTKRTPGKS